MVPPSKIVDRVRKLLELSRSPNLNEAAAAAEAAQRLMQEHKLSEVDVTSSAADGSEITSIPVGSSGYMASWKFALASDVARSFFCEAVGLRAGRRRKVRIVGRDDDARAAAATLAFLAREIERLADEGWRRARDGEEGALDLLASYFGPDVAAGLAPDSRSWKDAFRKGAATGAGEKLKARHRDFTASSERALSVVRRSRVEVLAYVGQRLQAPRTVDKGTAPRDDEAEAFALGFEAGSQIAVPGERSIEAEKGKET